LSGRVAREGASRRAPDRTGATATRGLAAGAVGAARAARARADRPWPAPAKTPAVLLHEAVFSIADARPTAALPPCAPALPARPRRPDQEHVALSDGPAHFFVLQATGRAPARLQPVAMRQAVLAAEQAVRRVAHAVARGVGPRRLFDVHAQPQHGADAAA